MARIIKAQIDESAPADSALLNLHDFVAEAQAVVLDARRQAARLLADARAKCRSVRLAAFDQGREEGFAAGKAQGFSQGLSAARDEDRRRLNEELSQLKDLAGRIVGEFDQARTELMHQARSDMLELVIELAEKVVGTLAAADISVARTNLAKALELSGGAGEALVKVNPSQLESLRTHCRELVDALGLGGAVRLAGDERISPGGVKIVRGGGQIDATIETQLANVVSALVGQTSAHAAQDEDAEATASPAYRAQQADQDEQLPLGVWIPQASSDGPSCPIRWQDIAPGDVPEPSPSTGSGQAIDPSTRPGGLAQGKPFGSPLGLAQGKPFGSPLGLAQGKQSEIA